MSLTSNKVLTHGHPERLGCSASSLARTSTVCVSTSRRYLEPQAHLNSSCSWIKSVGRALTGRGHGLVQPKRDADVGG